MSVLFLNTSLFCHNERSNRGCIRDKSGVGVEIGWVFYTHITLALLKYINMTHNTKLAYLRQETNKFSQIRYSIIRHVSNSLNDMSDSVRSQSLHGYSSYINY